MRKNKEVKISYFAAHLTTIISVTLLLLIVGCIGLLGVAARNTAREIKQMQQVSLVTADGISDAQAVPLLEYVKTQPYALDAHLVTKAEALAEWNAQTGENLIEVAGYNFLSPEVQFRLKEEFTSPAELNKIKVVFSNRPDVQEVVMPDTETTRGMDNFFSHAFIVLGVIALVMILISCVLINNTVLLTIYSRRFTIHTMQLVGATNSFIRRPFVLNNVISGVIAATIATGILWAVVAYLHGAEFSELYTYLNPGGIWIVVGALYVMGVIVCGLAALFATTRYLRRDYDELFRS